MIQQEGLQTQCWGQHDGSVAALYQHSTRTGYLRIPWSTPGALPLGNTPRLGGVCISEENSEDTISPRWYSSVMLMLGCIVQRAS
jgi:hypothetical protein